MMWMERYILEGCHYSTGAEWFLLIQMHGIKNWGMNENTLERMYKA